METSIKYLEIGFESVETLLIDINDVKELIIKRITESHHIEGINKKLITRKRCKKLSLTLGRTADKMYRPRYSNEPISTFYRLTKYDDIVDITYLDENKNIIDSVYVPWKNRETSGDNNQYQSHRITKNGDLEINIKEGI